MFDVFDGNLAPVVQNRGGFLKRNATAARVGERLLRIPVEHAQDGSDRLSTATYFRVYWPLRTNPLAIGRKARQAAGGRPACAPTDGIRRTHGIEAPGAQVAAAVRPWSASPTRGGARAGASKRQ